jgi:NADPH-dependent curcumin reductase CurA
MDDVVREVSGWLAAGRLRYRETVVGGLECAPEALARTLAGERIGKTLVRIRRA